MSYEVKMPQLGMNQDTAVVVAWFKKEGDKIEKGDPLFEVETDKATMEVEAQKEGYLSKIKVDEGSEVPVGQLLALISDTNEDSHNDQTDLADPDSFETIEPYAEPINDNSIENEVQNIEDSSNRNELSTRSTRNKAASTGVKVLASPKAKLAAKAKLDAIVCSAQEVNIVKKIFKKEIITPGIRFNSKNNDQKRTLTPKQAYKNGSDWLVIGRPITKGNIKENIKTLIDHLN